MNWWHWAIAVGGGVGLVIIAVYAAIVEGLYAADRRGLFPKNNIRKLNKEDGGSGPI